MVWINTYTRKGCWGALDPRLQCILGEDTFQGNDVNSTIANESIPLLEIFKIKEVVTEDLPKIHIPPIDDMKYVYKKRTTDPHLWQAPNPKSIRSTKPLWQMQNVTV